MNNLPFLLWAHTFALTTIVCFLCRWLEHVKSVLASDTLQGSENTSWAAYRSSLQQQPVSKESISITSLLPLFPDQAKSATIICHAMNVVREAVKILNPDQVPIITVVHCCKTNPVELA